MQNMFFVHQILQQPDWKPDFEPVDQLQLSQTHNTTQLAVRWLHTLTCEGVLYAEDVDENNF